jgi:Domain of unknown function (DUF3859)
MLIHASGLTVWEPNTLSTGLTLGAMGGVQTMEKRATLPVRAFLQSALMVLTCWLSATCADARPAKVERVDVVDHGIYLANKVAGQANELGFSHHAVSDPQLVAITDTIRAELGIKFGFRYSITGTPDDGVVTVKQVTIYPPQGVVSPKAGLLHQSSFSMPVQIISPVLGAGYEIEEPWELVPGVWTIQLWVGDQKLAEHSFTVITQGDTASKTSSLSPDQVEPVAARN